MQNVPASRARPNPAIHVRLVDADRISCVAAGW
jgi:hypothetical protein